MGKFHVCKSTVADEKSGNSALFLIVSKLSRNLSSRAKYSKALKRTYSKKHNKIEEENYIFYSISLKYTKRAHSYKNQMFLRLKYMPA